MIPISRKEMMKEIERLKKENRQLLNGGRFGAAASLIVAELHKMIPLSDTLKAGATGQDFIDWWKKALDDRNMLAQIDPKIIALVDAVKDWRNWITNPAIASHHTEEALILAFDALNRDEPLQPKIFKLSDEEEMLVRWLRTGNFLVAQGLFDKIKADRVAADSALIAQQLPDGLPPAYNNCQCDCHRMPGIMEQDQEGIER